MKSKKNEALSIILESLFNPYRNRVPDVGIIVTAMQGKGIIDHEKSIVNDHIAFRTLGVPHLGISSFEKMLLHYGYQKMDAYFFEQKKLDAFWYAPPEEHFPRVFLSELRVKDLTAESRRIIKKYTGHIEADPVDGIDLDDAEAVADFLHRPLWQLPSVQDYQALADESEYAAWTIYNRYYLNHYTISIHTLPEGYNTLESFNRFLESEGIVLNTSGGKIKTSADGLLRQSSTVAKLMEATFAGNESLSIAGSYVEFAERLPLPQYSHLPQNELTRSMRREGFESSNADKIFESTYNEQTKNLK